MKENFSADSLCMCCMSIKNSNGICQNCGFDENNYQLSPHHLPVRTILNGKYLVGRVLGEGGFGITYLGWDLNLDLKIAIKEFYPTGFVMRENTTTNTVTSFTGEKNQFFQSGREKFVGEAKSLAKFYSLPGIVSIKDFFLENGTAYIVMEYVDGLTFKQYLASMGGKIPAAQMFEMMKPLMKSLSEIHTAGIIHRDISPDNIMLTKEGNIKLLDFGAARDFANSGNKSLSVMLKPGYAPEEQYRSKGVQGPWTDIYALCATIYKAITGVTPDESSERIRHDELKKPSELGIAIILQQEAVLMKGIAVLQEERFQNINDLYNALYGTTNQEVASPIPTSNVSRPTPPKVDSQPKPELIRDLKSEIDIKPQPNIRKNKKWYGAVGIVAVVILSIVSIGLNKNYSILQSDFYDMESNYDQTKSDYDDMKNNYEDMKSNYEDMKSNYDQQVEFRERISKVIPIIIDNISLTNQKDGITLSTGTEFNRNDVRFIACYFNSSLISEKNTNTESIMVKFIDTNGEVITYSDGSSPYGFTKAVSFDDTNVSLGAEDGDGFLNYYPGIYKIEFWYSNLKITELSFIIN